MARYGLYAVDVDGVVIGGITRSNLRTGSEVRGEATSGEAYVRFVSLVGQRPGASFTSLALKAALDKISALGFAIKADDVVALYGQQWADGGTRTSGSAHRKFTLNKGMILPRRLSGRHQEDVSLDVDLVVGFDGTNDPIVIADGQALPAASVDAQRYAFRKATVGGVTLDEDIECTVDFGLRESREGKQSEIWDRMISISQVVPTITLRSKNVELLKSTNIPLIGKAATHANTTVFFAKRAEGGTFVADNTAEHIKITAAGMAVVEDVLDANGNETGTASLVLTCKFDGTNAPLVLDTASAIS